MFYHPSRFGLVPCMANDDVHSLKPLHYLERRLLQFTAGLIYYHLAPTRQLEVTYDNVYPRTHVHAGAWHKTWLLEDPGCLAVLRTAKLHGGGKSKGRKKKCASRQFFLFRVLWHQ
jgi:hypothetical protein